jgi:outer membrane receptor protein involved in Fe transport
MSRSSFCFLACLILSLAATAQLPTSTLNGTVTDPQGAVVAGAKVVITNTATGASREVTTAGDGGYTVTDLTPGTYSVRVNASGFAVSEFKEIHLDVGRVLTLDVSLKIAKAGEVVEVTGGEISVNTTQSEVQGLVSSTTVENIPLNGRNYLELAFLIPGNRPATNYDPTKTNTLEVSSAGQFGRGNNLTVDGGSNVDVVVGGTLLNFPQDSVQEFQIATNHFTAEVGNSGSSIINIATKSGTNDLHGSLFGFFRNKNLQGRAAVEDRTQPKPPFDRQQFGGSVGGPILKNRAWFFLSGEDRNQHAAVQVGQRKFGATNKIIVTGAAAPLDDLLTLGKLDFKLSSKDDFYVRYAYNRSIETANGSLGRPLGTPANRQNSLNRFNSFYGNWTRTFSSHLVNTVIENTNTFVNNIPAFSSSADTLCAGAAGYAGGCGTNPPGLGLTPAPVVEPAELRFASLQDGLNFRIPQRTRANTYEIQDALTWTRGVHTFHFGGRIQRQLIDALFDRNGSDPITLTQDFATQDLNGDGVINDLDIPISSVILSTAPVRPPTYPTYSNTALGWYVQDDWRLRSNLTLNLGIRYDFDTNVFANKESFQGCPTPLTTPPTQNCVWLRTLLGAKPHRDTADFGPRIGFAWDPFKTGKTVVRGGYGIYYDPIVLEVELLEGLFDGRRVSQGTLAGSVCSNVANGDCTLPGARFDNGTPTLFAHPGCGGTCGGPYSGAQKGSSALLFFVDPNSHHPTVQQFTLGVQHQFGQDWIVSADALHDFGYHFIIGKILDDSKGKFVIVTDPLTGRSTAVLDQAPLAKTWYDGLLVSAQKRPSRLFGLEKWQYTFSANYTLSKSFNYANDDQIGFNVNSPVATNFGFNNVALEKGFAPTDERHRFTLFGVLNAPYDFSFSPILTLTSSVPLDSLVPGLGIRLPILARDAIGRSIQNGRQLNAVIQKWNALPACGSAGAPQFPCLQGGPLPLVNPNVKYGDNFASLDFRVTKSFTFYERHKFDVIAEAFNIFNVTNIRGQNNNNYSGRVNDITATNFYQATTTAGGFFGAGGPRAFQFALRYSF